MRLYILLVSIVLIEGYSIENEWQNFKVKYEKKFTTSLEENERFVIFKDNFNKIKQHNSRYEEGLVSYKLGVNEFADLTTEEFAEKMLMKNKRDHFPTKLTVSRLSNASIPDTVDWREKGAVTKVKSQGECGSCYLFSVTGLLESHYFIKSGKLLSLSEQYLLDCDRGGNIGCQGGFPKNVLLAIRGYGALETYDYYSYDATVHVCRATNVSTLFTNIGYTKLVKDEDQMKIAVATIGPVAIVLDALEMKSYSGGIYDNTNCGRTNHAALVVGYGTSNGTDYWLVKILGDPTGERTVMLGCQEIRVTNVV